MAEALDSTAHLIGRYTGTGSARDAAAARAGVEKALRKAPPTTTGRFFAWLTDGMDREGRRYLASTIPGPVVLVLSKVLGRRYHRTIAPVWRSPR